jgi:hypothetical protein
VERRLSIETAALEAQGRRLARSRARVAELESLGLLRGIRFAIGQRRRAMLPSARRR